MSKELTPKERLERALEHKAVDRPPCICPGGMMNMVTEDIMDRAGVWLPEAHTDAAKMAALARAAYEAGCFENVGVPFCMTVEAEAMGATVDLGTSAYEPHVTGYAMGDISDLGSLSAIDLERGRARVTLDAIRLLHEQVGSYDTTGGTTDSATDAGVPVIGNLTGPVSIATSVVDPSAFYRALNKDKEHAHALLEFITEQCECFVRAMVKAGADVIAIEDPSATGEILGPRHFAEFAVPYINRIIRAVRDESKQSVGVIVHICGQIHSIYSLLDNIDCDALSFDSAVSLRQARESLPGRVLMGNVSTYALEFGTPNQVHRLTRACVESGSDILAPACGLGMRSPLANVHAMLQELRDPSTQAAPSAIDSPLQFPSKG